MANTSLLGSYGDNSGAGLMFRNALINGNFSVWQRAASQTSAGYGSDDRWVNDHSGSTKTHSQQTFTLGQTDVPGNPIYFSRTAVTSVAGAGNFVLKTQRIESVRTFSGQTATLSFWAKADAPKNMAVEFVQSFGTGGSPSATVTAIGVTTCALTASWKQFTITVSVPSISGKTLGTADDGYLAVNFWFDGGSAFNARTNSLGQQSGTFDFAQVQLEAGPVATPFERRPFAMELALCERYYESNRQETVTSGSGFTPAYPVPTYGGAGIPNLEPVAYVQFRTIKRVIPTFKTYSTVSPYAADKIRTSGLDNAVSYTYSGSNTVTVKGATAYNATGAAFPNVTRMHFSYDAEAEL